MKKEDIKFEIDQLRKDKIIYALESIATSFAMFLIILGLGFTTNIKNIKIIQIAFLVALVYWVYTVYGNTVRLIRIRKLEKKLKKK